MFKKVALVFLAASVLGNLYLFWRVQKSRQVSYLSITTQNGLKFDYPKGWQIVDFIDSYFGQTDRKSLNIESDEKIFINYDAHHLWGNFEPSTTLIVWDMFFADPNQTAQGFLSDSYEEYRRNAVRGVLPAIFSQTTSPSGIKILKSEGHEFTENQVVTDYAFDYVARDGKKRVVRIYAPGVGRHDTPESLAIQKQIINSLKLPNPSC